jgi:hypothetical protein
MEKQARDHQTCFVPKHSSVPPQAMRGSLSKSEHSVHVLPSLLTLQDWLSGHIILLFGQNRVPALISVGGISIEIYWVS